MNSLRWLKEQNEQIYTEVCEWDVYGLRGLAFEPDVIIDVGANIGGFSAFARMLYPQSCIIAIEPHAETWARCRDNLAGSEVDLRQAALGPGPFTWRDGHYDWRHSYRSLSVTDDDIVQSDVAGVMLDELIPDDAKNYVVKLDCEGAEHDLLCHPASLQALCNSAYWTAEIHFDEFSRDAGPAPVDNAAGGYFASHRTAIVDCLSLAYLSCGTHCVQIKDIWLSGALIVATRRADDDPWRQYEDRPPLETAAVVRNLRTGLLPLEENKDPAEHGLRHRRKPGLLCGLRQGRLAELPRGVR